MGKIKRLFEVDIIFFLCCLAVSMILGLVAAAALIFGAEYVGLKVVGYNVLIAWIACSALILFYFIWKSRKRGADMSQIKRLLIPLVVLFAIWIAYESGRYQARQELGYWECPAKSRLEGFLPGANRAADREEERAFQEFWKSFDYNKELKSLTDPEYGIQLG